MGISKRLNDFLNNHVEYEDDGDAENGPHLTYDYVGPEWAMELAGRTEDPQGWKASCMYEWEFSEVWYA